MTPQELRDAIGRLGISQVEFARRLGVDPSTVRRWLSGSRTVPPAVKLVIDCWLRYGLPTK